MNLPSQYSYNPRSWLFASSFGASFAWLTIMGFDCGCWPHGFMLWFGLAPAIFGLLLAVRQFAFTCYLVLDEDALILPTGFGRVRTTRIPYMSIERVWESSLPFTRVLSLATKEGKFEVLSTMLPNTDSYIEIGKFLYARADKPKSR